MLTSRSSYRLVRCHGPLESHADFIRKSVASGMLGLARCFDPPTFQGFGYVANTNLLHGRLITVSGWGCRGYQNRSIASGMSGERREVGDSS